MLNLNKLDIKRMMRSTFLKFRVHNIMFKASATAQTTMYNVQRDGYGKKNTYDHEKG